MNITKESQPDLNALRVQVCEANLDLKRHQLVTFTWGNVSGIDRERGLIVIKPSGLAYEKLRPENMAVVDLDGNSVSEGLNPSSDTLTHVFLYKKFLTLGGIVHTHSSLACAWAQAGKSIPSLGTTHADYFYGDIPCTRKLSSAEINKDYELNTGKVIVETFSNIDPNAVPGVVVNEHGPFTWGKDPDQAVHNAVVLEEVAKMTLNTLNINPDVAGLQQALLDKHYKRKHGANAYYGQK